MSKYKERAKEFLSETTSFTIEDLINRKRKTLYVC